MKPHTVFIGSAAYEVEDVFLGKQSAPELLLDRLTRQILAEPAFDAGRAHGV